MRLAMTAPRHGCVGASNARTNGRVDTFPYRNMIASCPVPRRPPTLQRHRRAAAPRHPELSRRRGTRRSATSSTRWAWPNRRCRSTCGCCATSGLVDVRRDGRQVFYRTKPRRSGRCTSGPASSNATGATSSAASRNAPNAIDAGRRAASRRSHDRNRSRPRRTCRSTSPRKSTSARRSRRPSRPSSRRWDRGTRDTTARRCR